MEISFSHTFKKQFKKLPKKQQEQFIERFNLWQVESSHPLLRLHPLVGAKKGHWSFNVNGDIRVLYRYESENEIMLMVIGTHSQLY